MRLAARRERGRAALRRGAARLPRQHVDGAQPAACSAQHAPRCSTAAWRRSYAPLRRSIVAQRVEVVRGRPADAGADLGAGRGLRLAVAAAPAGALLLGSLFMVYQYAQQAGRRARLDGRQLPGLRPHAAPTSPAPTPIWAAPRARRRRPPSADAGDWRTLALRRPGSASTSATCASSTPCRRPSARGGLHGVSLTLHRGERIALVGPSGSRQEHAAARAGRAVRRRSAATSTVDGVAAARRCAALAELATLIPQEAEVFEASVRENIAFDLPHRRRRDRAARCASARFDAVLDDAAAGPGDADVASAASTSRAASASACAWRAACSPRAAARCCCSTSRPARSTR